MKTIGLKANIEEFTNEEFAEIMVCEFEAKPLVMASSIRLHESRLEFMKLMEDWKEGKGVLFERFGSIGNYQEYGK